MEKTGNLPVTAPTLTNLEETVCSIFGNIGGAVDKIPEDGVQNGEKLL